MNPMASSKGLPAHLAAARQRDSNDKLARVEKLRDKIKADAKAGRLSWKYVDQLGLASFCLEAGVSENYLNGKRLREGIKPEIKALIAKLKRQMNEAASEELNPDGAPDTQKLQDLQVQNARLVSMLHAARLQLHSQRQIIKSLRERCAPKVVSLVRD